MAAHSSVIVWRIPGATVHGVSESAVAELPVRPGLLNQWHLPLSMGI